MSIATDIVKRASQKGLKITTVESCTGGMVSVAITNIAGSSAMFERGFVTYSNQAKMELVDVQRTTLDEYDAVSEQVAREMATGGLIAAAADIAISVSGIAGPGGSDHKPQGRVCFALATKRGVTSEAQEFSALGREAVRLKARDHALILVQTTLQTF